MTLRELRAHLNELRVDPAWKQGWLDRGADFDLVLRTIREKLLRRAIDCLDAADMDGWAAAVCDILAFVAYDPVGDHMIRGVEPGDPECDTEAEAEKMWVEFVTRCNPNQTYTQALVVFHDRYGFWPKRHWPGVALSSFDRGRKLKHIPRDRLQPGLPADMSNEPIPD